MRQVLEELGGATRGHPRRPVHDEVLLQAPLVRLARSERERDAGVAPEVAQLPLIRQRRQDDLVPFDPDPSSRDVGPAIIVDRDHVGDGIALEELSSRLGERDPYHRRMLPGPAIHSPEQRSRPPWEVRLRRRSRGGEAHDGGSGGTAHLMDRTYVLRLNESSALALRFRRAAPMSRPLGDD